MASTVGCFIFSPFFNCPFGVAAVASDGVFDTDHAGIFFVYDVVRGFSACLKLRFSAF